ncbi:hypothetical protein M0R01_05005 [bacterium]|nr:hypothetical protein [bacterium]
MKKISKLRSIDIETITLYADELGRKYTKEVLDYYLILIKNTAISANKRS